MPSPSAIQLYFKSNFLLAILGGVLVVMLYFNVYEEGWGQGIDIGILQMYSLSAGQETTSNHLSFTLYEILKHPNIEDRYDGYGLYTICLLLQRSLSLLFFIRSSLMMFIIYTSYHCQSCCSSIPTIIIKITISSNLISP